MSGHVRVEVIGGVMILTLLRPEKMNALSNAMYSALADALDCAEADTSVRVVLFLAEGDHFTAGNDLGDFAQAAAADPKKRCRHSDSSRGLRGHPSRSSPGFRAMQLASGPPCCCIVISCTLRKQPGCRPPLLIWRWSRKRRRVFFCRRALAMPGLTRCSH